MDVITYLRGLRAETQLIFDSSLEHQADLGSVHHLASCIYEFSDCLVDATEKNILVAVSTQLESATLSAVMGMYRQSFGSLRLGLEMGLGVIYFSVYRLELREWLEGRADLKWNVLIDENNGVLSSRFAKAFFEELSLDCNNYRIRAAGIYRKLSEYVHGNYDTWSENGMAISYDSTLLKQYFSMFSEVANVVLFALVCRYYKSLTLETLDSLGFIAEEFMHIQAIQDQIRLANE